MRGITTFCLYLICCAYSLSVFAEESGAGPSQVAENSIAQQDDNTADADEGSQIEMMWEFDPYYSDVAVNVPLTSKPIPTIRSTNEAVIYSRLIQGSFIPRYMLLEASVYPMPLLGVYLKENQQNLYEQGRVGHTSINIIESATAGFQEPWAISAFFGNIAKIVRPGEKRNGSSSGYTGYLLSTGAKHIKSNMLIDDKWLEVEWKIKGKVDYPGEKISWSFRVGAKFHEHMNIPDVMYVNLFRSNLNAKSNYLEWINNSTMDVKWQFTEGDFQLVRQEYVIGKKFPHWAIGKDYTPTLDIGVIWSAPAEYSGILRTTNENVLTLVFRPSIQF